MDIKVHGPVIVVVALGMLFALWATNAYVDKTSTYERACTEEAKICPDGSSVGRIPPDCEFAACPSVVATTTTATTSDVTSTGTATPIPQGSGVKGTILLGPTCPVERIPPDPNCAPKPYATSITVYRSGSKLPYIIGNSNTDGAFQLTLPVGSYMLNAGGTKILPRCSEVSVTIPPNAFITQDISCDTGIR